MKKLTIYAVLFFLSFTLNSFAQKGFYMGANVGYGFSLGGRDYFSKYND